MIKNVVFDIGNVLVTFGWYDFFKSFNWTDEVFDRVVKATVKDIDWNEMDRGVLTDEEVLDLFIENDPGVEKELREMYVDYHDLLVKFDYTDEWIKSLQNRGLRVFCLSNMSFKAVRECTDALNFIPSLDGDVLSCYYRIIKPDDAIYKLLCEKYDLKPEECVFIDDLQRNVEAAQKNGFQSFVFIDKEQADKKINELMGV